MKLRAPEGCSTVSHRGRLFIVAPDRSIEVAESAAASLAAHGFLLWEEARPGEPAAALRDDLEFGDLGVESLNRPALFALLRKRGVRVSLPITNDDLRAAVRASLAKL